MLSPLGWSLSLACLAGAVAAHAIALPQQTAIPVMFTKTVDAAKAKPGDPITARTMQSIKLPNGALLPRGAVVTGHIVEARAFHYDDTDYAVQQASYLAIRLDTVVDNGAPVPLTAQVRALASAHAAEDAEWPHRADDTDAFGTMVLVGGAHYSPVDRQVRAGEEDDVVAYNRKQGVFAHLLPAEADGGLRCGGTETEQAVGIFSPDACGLYGFPSTALSQTAANGTFRLASTHRTVVLRAGSAALLQVE